MTPSRRPPPTSIPGPGRMMPGYGGEWIVWGMLAYAVAVGILALGSLAALALGWLP